ncbi:DUF4150 domain-containing protein [Budviciaceae bacterium CWB-B4]|uniref:DUF4150 domain-containing protein n=1 Tax=Limnobaculum xujianqingii TaxID=2738837 RepID=A0A9D7FRG9_9GAMM|nr:DUF4150 domain-containing protein [Limnobaculum xujianqingii]MBK5072178.1 DUF4150 domain-containing protein [Limnobaculum xujianqingii]MBK5175487.1 DUF4150 domain-containing protein [Limnobaculum xujianqingii]
MAKEVYANHDEISGKASGVTAFATTPDVCHTPPPPPPLVAAKIGIPVPYPNFSDSCDTVAGTKTIKLRGKMACRKNKSYYKTSKGDELATSQFRKGILNQTIKGETYATRWSFDVKFEKKNVVRHSDSTKHNVKKRRSGTAMA